jgi:branched-chain amino acid transport system permease protein
MSLFLPAVVSGISVGLLYGLLGFSIVTLYKASATLSFAQPAIGMFTTFIAYFMYSKWGVPATVAVILGLVAAGVLGAVMYLVAMRPNDTAGAANRSFRTLAMYSLLIAIATTWFASGQPFRFPIPTPSGSVTIGDSAIPKLSFVTLVVAVVLCAGILVFFRWTPYGLLFRAVADDREVARLLGIRARRITALVWIVGTVIACIVGLLTVPTAFVSTDTLSNYAIFALAGVFLGGLTAWTGAFVGGIVVGIVSNVAFVYLSQEAALGIVFLILLAVLTIRPQGILGDKAVTRV